jgi:hypothetical protein
MAVLLMQFLLDLMKMGGGVSDPSGIRPAHNMVPSAAAVAHPEAHQHRALRSCRRHRDCGRAAADLAQCQPRRSRGSHSGHQVTLPPLLKCTLSSAVWYPGRPLRSERDQPLVSCVQGGPCKAHQRHLPALCGGGDSPAHGAHTAPARDQEGPVTQLT